RWAREGVRDSRTSPLFDAHFQVGGGNLRLGSAAVLGFEQLGQLTRELVGPADLFGRGEGVHRGAVVAAESLDEVRRSSGLAEVPGGALELDVLGSDSGGLEALADLRLVAPGHGADEAG